jgi:hypothetical protein
MARMGHDSERAALIYLHSSAERQRSLADAVGDAPRAELAKAKKAKRSGARVARNHRPAAETLRVRRSVGMTRVPELPCDTLDDCTIGHTAGTGLLLGP